jgi:thiamine kinase-like enzyme
MQDYLKKYYKEGDLINPLLDDFEIKTGDSEKFFIHGDFQPSNVIIKDSKIWLIDFNDSAKDIPMIDVSCFLSQLRVALFRKNNANLFKSLEKIFIDEYVLQAEINEKELKTCLGLQYLKILSVICWLDNKVDKKELFDEVFSYWKENE